MGQIGNAVMIKRLIKAAFVVVVIGFAAQAQIRTDQKCREPIYGGRELAKRAKITEPADLSIIYKEVAPNARGTVVLEAVLCRTGQVTDIRISKGLSSTIDDFVAAAVSLVKFEPAEINWHSVSQRIQFEFHFGPNEPGVQINTSAEAVGRIVESVDIVGNRRLTAQEIRSWIKTRPGERYSAEQIRLDFNAILATSNFDKTQTRVLIEDGVRGGVVVIFEVVELPVIAEVVFEGLKFDRSLILEALKKEGIFLKVGSPYDTVPVKRAARIIKEVLVSSGYGDSTVDPRIEQVSAASVKVIFVITNQ